MASSLILTLIDQVELISEKEHGGHYAIYKFPNHYKGVYGTFTESQISIMEQVAKMKHFPSLEKLLFEMIKHPEHFASFSK